MSLTECNKEREQLLNIKGIEVARTGFVSSSGFDFTDTKDYILISGDDLYQLSPT